METSQPRHLPIEETNVYKKFRDLSNEIWRIAAQWKAFPQNTVGTQIVRAADSVCANLVEGGGRTSHADALRFFGIARASARETIFWIGVATDRELIPSERAAGLHNELDEAARMLNGLIAYRRKQGGFQVREDRAEYSWNQIYHLAPEHPAPST